MYVKVTSCLLSICGIPGVLQRIALCYCAISFTALFMNHKFIPTLTFILLVSYTVILCMGNGYTCDESNILSIIDRQLFGEAHLYQKSPIDPEGFVSTFCYRPHLYRFFMWKMDNTKPSDRKQSAPFVLLTGFILMSIGYLLADALPLNKRIWSPTFVLVTCGAASMSLATLMYYIDIRNKQKWCRFFIIFGVNPLFLYVLASTCHYDGKYRMARRQPMQPFIQE